jgi:excisionase family DNA binding protein
MERVRVGVAAKRLGVHADTIRRWGDEGRFPSVRVAGQRRYLISDLDAFVAGGVLDPGHRREALYLRVSPTSGQETSLVAQEAELRTTATGDVVEVQRDTASGLRENRPGLARLLAHAAQGKFDVVRVTHEDRLACFGAAWIIGLLDRDGVSVEVLHTKGSAGGMDELLADFMSLVASFAGRMYGIRGREAKARLLASASGKIGDTDVAD